MERSGGLGGSQLIPGTIAAAKRLNPIPDSYHTVTPELAATGAMIASLVITTALQAVTVEEGQK